ncbi:MAG: hypothetical protein WKG07_23740 [Hymenobacter sp.]
MQLGFNRKYELFYEAPGPGPPPPRGLWAGHLPTTKAAPLDCHTRGDRRLGLLGAEWRLSHPAASTLTGGPAACATPCSCRTAFDVSYHREQISWLHCTFDNLNYFLGRTSARIFRLQPQQHASISVTLLPTRSPGSLRHSGLPAHFVWTGPTARPYHPAPGVTLATLAWATASTTASGLSGPSRASLPPPGLRRRARSGLRRPGARLRRVRRRRPPLWPGAAGPELPPVQPRRQLA